MADIFGNPVVTQYSTIRGDKAKITISGDDSKLGFAVMNYTITYANNFSMQRDLADPGKAVLVKLLPNPGTVTIGILIGEFQSIKTFVQKFQECEKNSVSITWDVTAPLEGCAEEKLSLKTIGCIPNNINISGAVTTPFTMSNISLLFSSLEFA